MREKFLDIVRGELGPTRSEPGCLAFQLCTNQQDDIPDIRLIQLWRNREALERYIRGARFRSLLIAIDLLEEAPRVVASRVTDLQTFETFQDFFDEYAPG